MITGASSGIGRGLAFDLASRGAKLGLVARRREKLEEIVGEITSKGGTALALPGNVEDAAAMRELATRLENEIGPIDIMVANAGIGSTTDAAELQASEVARVVGVNVIGAAASV